jgi:hypothetical protein
MPDDISVSGEPWYLLPAPPLGPFEEVLPVPRMFSSACWRGYIGEWIVSDDTLLLEAIRLEQPPGETYEHDFVVVQGRSLQVKGGPIQTAWITTQFRIGRGDVLNRPSYGVLARFTDEMLVTVDAGRVVSIDRLPPYDGPRRIKLD